MGSQTQWSLTFAGVQKTWLFLMIALVAFLALSFSWIAIRRIRSRQRRLLIFSLRVAATFLIIAAVLQPQLLQQEVLRIKNKVALVFDSSQSMSLKDKETDIMRFQMARQFLKDNQPFFDQLERSFDVDYLAFSETVQELNKESLDGLSPKGIRTDITNLLKDLKKRYTDAPIKGIFVLSDGTDTSGIMRAAVEDNALKLAKELPAPVHAFCTGNPDAVKDVAIHDIVYDDFAFVRNPWHIDVTIKLTGFESLSFPVTLKQGENIIASKSVLTTGDEDEYHVSMSFIPYTTGTFLYTISIPVQVGEVVTDNNIASFQIHVIRDKIRIMHLCGRPSWDERFLREVLKKDPHIDLISFFILRTPSDIIDASNKELSLIPFPAEELFTQVLDSFDIVIFQNFDYRPYDLSLFRFPYYLSKIRDYVFETAGGFIMIGGDLAFSQGGYDGTPIEDIIPVDLDGEQDRIDTENFHAVLTTEGLRHPITMFDHDEDRNSKIWQSLPQLNGCNVITKLKDDGVPLAECGMRNAEFGITPHSEAPVVAVMDVGKGRSMVVLTDSLWRWNFLAVGAGGSNRHYVRFWQTAVRWLIKDPELNLVRVSTNKEVFLPGENVEVRIKVLGRDYQPEEGANVTVEITNASHPQGEYPTTLPPPTPQGEGMGWGGKTDKDGQYNFSFKPEQEGYHTVKASAAVGAYSNTPLPSQKDVIGEATTVFNVESLNREFKDPSINEGLLKEISKLSGGKYFTLPARDIQKKLTIENPEVIRFIGKRSISLWDNWFIYVAIVGTLAAEWWLRKSSGIN